MFKRIEGIDDIVERALHLLLVLDHGVLLFAAHAALVFIVAEKEFVVPHCVPQGLDIDIVESCDPHLKSFAAVARTSDASLLCRDLSPCAVFRQACSYLCPFSDLSTQKPSVHCIRRTSSDRSWHSDDRGCDSISGSLQVRREQFCPGSARQ